MNSQPDKINIDKSNVIKLVQQYANVIKDRYDYSQVILFGSYAKGTNNENSDIDVAVVLKEFDNTFDVQLDLMRLRRKIDSRIEPHPFKLSEFNNSNPLVHEIISYGKRIDSAFTS
ncbi:MAG: nucleotidyltransferase domain-containing protein [Bacteroidales bacterium]|nr:nucleotidyltransferase domain-containing protein [Bacteroidales bacterium]